MLLQALRRFFFSINANAAQEPAPRRSPARKLMEAAQVRSANSAQEARELRRAAIAQLRVVR